MIDDAPCSVSAFAAEHALTLRMDRGPGDLFNVRLVGCEVKKGRLLLGACGYGATPHEALSDYCRRISGKTMVHSAMTDDRRLVQCPWLLTADAAAVAAITHEGSA